MKPIFLSNLEKLLILDDTKIALPNNITYKEIGEIIYFPSLKLGNGTFGEVFYGLNKDKTIELAIKKDKDSNQMSFLFLEPVICTFLSHEKGFQRFYDFEIENRKNLMAQSLLGLSLNKLFHFYGNNFDDFIVSNIGLELIDRIHFMHKMEISLNDIKPSNILWGRVINSTIADKKTLYCIDFGKSSKIKNKIKFNDSQEYKLNYNDLKQKSNVIILLKK